jgi:predicted glycoside hydrolase/deacetylase ChbG (UPF0249 family)
MHIFPQIRDAVLAATKEQAPGAWIRQCGRRSPWRKRLSDAKGLFLDLLSIGFRRRAAQLGIRTNPAFAGTYYFRPDDEFAALFPVFLENLPDGSVVMCHPGHVDAELRSVDPVTTARENEYAYLAGEQFPKDLQEHGLTLA